MNPQNVIVSSDGTIAVPFHSVNYVRVRQDVHRGKFIVTVFHSGSESFDAAEFGTADEAKPAALALLRGDTPPAPAKTKNA